MQETKDGISLLVDFYVEKSTAFDVLRAVEVLTARTLMQHGRKVAEFMARRSVPPSAHRLLTDRMHFLRCCRRALFPAREQDLWGPFVHRILLRCSPKEHQHGCVRLCLADYLSVHTALEFAVANLRSRQCRELGSALISCVTKITASLNQLSQFSCSLSVLQQADATCAQSLKHIVEQRTISLKRPRLSCAKPDPVDLELPSTHADKNGRALASHHGKGALGKYKQMPESVCKLHTFEVRLGEMQQVQSSQQRTPRKRPHAERAVSMVDSEIVLADTYTVSPARVEFRLTNRGQICRFEVRRAVDGTQSLCYEPPNLSAYFICLNQEQVLQLSRLIGQNVRRLLPDGVSLCGGCAQHSTSWDRREPLLCTCDGCRVISYCSTRCRQRHYSHCHKYDCDAFQRAVKTWRHNYALAERMQLVG